MLYLASRSPRRRELLGQLGVAFESIDVEVPEVRAVGEAARDYVDRVARDKAHAGSATARDRDAHAIVLGADTEVVLDENASGEIVASRHSGFGLRSPPHGDFFDRVFGKPRDADDAKGMLRALSGRTHRVISIVWCVVQGREESAESISEVRFAPLSQEEIEDYVATGEPFGKAGAYAIQGRGALLIEHLSGSYTGVMGLPLFETARLLRGFGVECLRSCRA